MGKYADLKRQIEELQIEAEEARKEELEDAINTVKAFIKEYGLTPKDIFGNASDTSRKEQKPRKGPKYQNPSNPAETWTGHGRAPKWFNDEIDTGTKKEAMLIEKSTEAPT